MNDHTSSTEDAGRLIRFGLSARLRPSTDPIYQELLRRFRSEGELREKTEAVARGLGILILGATDHGLAIAAEDDSPFAQRLSDYHGSQSRTVSDRMCQGILQLAIASWCFPRASDLLDGDTVVTARISVEGLVKYLTQLCESIRKQDEQHDALHNQPALQEAYNAILNRAETKVAKDGRRSASSLSGMAAFALKSLESAGLMRKVGDTKAEEYQALGAYRLQVKELAAHESFLLLRTIATDLPQEHC